MKYNHIEQGIFLERPNRFIANVKINGKVEICHVKNTGRCRELLIPGVPIYTQRNDNPNRKTKLDLISVYKGDELINMDSQVPNKVVLEWIKEGNLFQDITLIKPEKTYGNSRFDIYIEADHKKIFMEVKGVTLEEDQVTSFTPNEKTHPEFMEALKVARDKGVHILAYDCIVTEDAISIDQEIPIRL